MATYAIGDIQGCFRSFERLLTRIAFDPEADRLWVVGDLVNRGPQSLEVLRWMREHDEAVVAVLGNHDLHLLARHAGVIQASRSDTLAPVLEAPDVDALIEWLAARPIAHADGDLLMIHAGLLPTWSRETAIALASEIEAELRGPYRTDFLHALYHERPKRFRPNQHLRNRRLAAAAVFTRLRAVDAEGQMVPRFKGPPDSVCDGQVPWFLHPERKSADTTIVFGHWATLGLWIDDRVVALDSGCVWGGSLTAFRLEDRAVFSVPVTR
ncbi:MAG: symmetrical bis(5'-nucleosyl)-tetraphosphatase [Deltaproteobacteria bacterium]|nr:MAG: symmetrical bis(5'-nucleosyl)-tetraphosphatase [Deltaproteobacteria bacterium]